LGWLELKLVVEVLREKITVALEATNQPNAMDYVVQRGERASKGHSEGEGPAHF